jgi:hypothetical protein
MDFTPYCSVVHRHRHTRTHTGSPSFPPSYVQEGGWGECVGCVASVVGRWGAVVVSVLAGEVVDVGGGVGKKASVCPCVLCDGYCRR